MSMQQYLPQQWPESFFTALEDPALARNWQSAGSADVATCLAAYKTNTQGGRIRALEITYPVVRQMLGAASFDAYALRFVERYPAQVSDLNLFGGQFGAFLREQGGLIDYPYISGMAELEWLIQDVRQSELATPLTADLLRQMDDSDLAILQVQRSPSVRLFESEYNLHQLWQWHQHPEGEPELQADRFRIALNMRWGAAGWALNMAEVTFEQQLLIDDLQQPKLLTEVLERFASCNEDLSRELNHWLLQNWLEVVHHDQ